MTKATVFISYHPQYLPDYVNLCRLDGGRSRHILVLCRHTYLTQAIIDQYSPKFDAVIVLPDISYDKNLPAGFAAYLRFSRDFRDQFRQALGGAGSFAVVSCCSAWMAVNAVLSQLRREPGFKSLATVCQHIASKGKGSLLRTILISIYTSVFRLMPAYFDSIHGYFYRKIPWNSSIKFIGPYEELPPAGDAACIRRPCRPQAKDRADDLVVFYSDRYLDPYNSSFPREERSRLTEEFLRRLADFYKAQIIVCSPHPLDKGVPIDEMRAVKYTLSDQELLTQMYLELNRHRVKACYAVSSTSLLYSSSVGIPSYSLYKYLGYSEDKNLKIFFEGPAARKNPYLFNISSLEEIGRIDGLETEPARDGSAAAWDGLMYSGTGAEAAGTGNI